MIYAVSKSITQELDFSCEDGNIILLFKGNVEVNLTHEEMKILVQMWLKCIELEKTSLDQETILSSLKLIRVVHCNTW
jgi:hypothetical protein